MIDVLHLMLRKELDERPSANELLRVDEVKMKMLDRYEVPESLAIDECGRFFFF